MNRRSVLVVEENDLLRWSITQYLSGDYSIIVATSGDEAARMLQQLDVSGLVVGCPLSPMTCSELCAMAKQQRPGVWVMALPEMPDHLTLCACQHAEFDAVMPKPVDLADLKGVADDLTARNRSSAAVRYNQGRNGTMS